MEICTFCVLRFVLFLSFHLYGSDVLRCLQCANQIGSLVGTDKRGGLGCLEWKTKTKKDHLTHEEVFHPKLYLSIF